LVERRSPKPYVEGSSPSARASQTKNRLAQQGIFCLTANDFVCASLDKIYSLAQFFPLKSLRISISLTAFAKPEKIARGCIAFEWL
ncbi:MAG: hypothetical protein J1F28_03675, partial [Oscillospiraceae bacterium]|nr:hypothetical protein [Oscillospiraceae bacterium]